MRKSGGVLAAVCLLAGSALAAPPSARPADPPPPEIPDFRIAIASLLAVRYNPLGLEEQLRIGLQKRLYNNEKLAMRDNFVFFGLSTKLSPAFIKVGPSLDIQPMAMLNLRFTAEVMGWFGSFGYLQSFGSPQDNYSDSTITRLKDAGSNYVAAGAHFTIEPLVQAKFGPIVLRNRLSVEYWRMSVRAGDTVFYDPTLDTLIPANGWLINDDIDLLYVSKKRFVVGIRYSVVMPIYSATDFRAGEVQEHDNGHHRLGPLLAYTFFDRGYTRFNKPSLILILNWYADHRWRNGADVHPGIPYLVLAFAFTSDLIPK
jgi:hypothetical protein